MTKGTGRATIPKRETLGLDIGRVITSDGTDGSPSIFDDENYLQATLREGALQTIRDLHMLRFGHNIHLLSKCKPKIQQRTLELLGSWDFYESTGIEPENVHFCLTTEEKGPIAKRLGITHFVDDRLKVLRIMPKTVIQKILFIPDEETISAPFAADILQAQGWQGVRTLLLPEEFKNSRGIANFT